MDANGLQPDHRVTLAGIAPLANSAVRQTSGSGTKKHILFVRDSKRAHKLRCLMIGLPVIEVASTRELLRALRNRRQEVGLVVIDSFGRWAILGVIAAAIGRAPLLIRLRGDFFREARDRLFNSSGRFALVHYIVETCIARLCLRRTTAVIFNSRYLFASFQNKIGRRPSAVVYNPFTPLGRGKTKSEGFPHARLRLLTVTNLNLWSKASPLLQMLDDPFTRSLLEAEDVCWIICGGGTLETRLRKELSSLGIADRVIVAGEVPDIAEYYEWSDVVVHLTRMDSFPNVTLEAMAYGRPVIINADSCGTREQIAHGFNGFVVAGAIEFREALVKYAGDAKTRAVHGQHGR